MGDTGPKGDPGQDGQDGAQGPPGGPGPIRGYEFRSATGDDGVAGVSCTGDRKVLGGGGQLDATVRPPPRPSVLYEYALAGSRPTSDERGWIARALSSDGARKVTVWAICADVAP